MKRLLATLSCALVLTAALSPTADAKHRHHKRHHVRVAKPAPEPCFIFCPSSAPVSVGAAGNSHRDTYASMVSSAASAAGVPSGIAHGVVISESRYNPGLRGRAGEYGMMQIKCQTARGEGFSGNCSELFDPAINLKYGMSYLAKALAKGGAGCAGASLYQSGLYGRGNCSAYGRAVMTRSGG